MRSMKWLIKLPSKFKEMMIFVLWWKRNLEIIVSRHEIPSPISIELKEGNVDSDSTGACDEQHPDNNHFTDNLLPISVVKYEETELAVKVSEYKWKPQSLYGAFCRALIEENMIKNDTDKVLDASFPLDVKLQLDLPAESNSFQSGKWDQYFNDATLEIMFGEIVVFKFDPGIGPLFERKFQSIQDAQMDEHVMKEYASSLSIVHSTIVSGNKHLVIEVELSTLIDSELLLKKFSFDPGGCPLSNLKMYEQSTLIELNKGGVVDKGDVLSVIDLQATHGPLGDIILKDTNNNSSKAWHDEVTLAIKNVPRKYAIVDDAYNEFGEMTQAIRATLLDGEVRNHSAEYADFNKLILLDPDGNRKFVMSFSIAVAHLLFGKAHEVFVVGFKAKQNIRAERLETCEPSLADFQDFAMEMVFREMMVLMFGPSISSLLEKMFLSYQEAQLDEQVLHPYTNDFYFNNRTIFDPGGDIYYALSYDNDALLSLWGNHKIVGLSMSVSFCSILAPLHDTDEMQSARHWHILEINFHFWCNPVGMSEYYVATMMKIVVAILAGFVWDLGQAVIFFYIIEDNDVVKRKGIGIELASALKQNDAKLYIVAMQIAQMLQLVEYGGYPYNYVQ